MLLVRSLSHAGAGVAEEGADLDEVKSTSLQYFVARQLEDFTALDPKSMFGKMHQADSAAFLFSDVSHNFIAWQDRRWTC